MKQLTSTTIDDSALFDKSFSALSKNKLTLARKLLQKISDPYLNEFANSNLAYIYALENNISMAEKLWRENTKSKNPNISENALKNLYHLINNALSGTDSFDRLSGINLIYPPIEIKQNTEQLRTKIKNLIFSSIIKDDRFFKEMFIKTPKLIRKNASYASVSDFNISVDFSFTKALTDFSVNWQLANHSQLNRYHLSWQKRHHNWLISSIKLLNPSLIQSNIQEQ